MSLLAVTERELRAAARQPGTYWVRVLGVLALLGILCSAVAWDPIGSQLGGPIFGSLHCTLLCAVWILVPLLTADCISRERREGTLPLLFLTPLKAHQIVNAKGMAHGLRALTLWLAVLPVLAIPVLAGGVGASEIVMSALGNFSSLCLAIAAGILASSVSRAWGRAMAMAVFLAFWLAVLFIWALPFMITFARRPTGRPFPNYYQPEFGMGLMYLVDPGGIWQTWSGRFRTGSWTMVYGYLIASVACVLVLLLVILLAAWGIRRVWREEPPSARVQWLQHHLTKPLFFQPLLKRWLQWQLYRNPIGWLEQRNWSSRIVVWSWFAVVVCVYSSLLTNFYLWQRAFHSIQVLLATLLAGSIAMSAAGSFRRERETGVLELLLVAPMDEWHIIAGRLRGLWTQFTPSIVLLSGVWLYTATFLATHSTKAEVISVFFYSVAFATIPVIGLYYSLARTTYMGSLLSTFFVGFAVPAIGGQLINLWADAGSSLVLRNLVPALVQALIAFLLAVRLHYCLKHRRFTLEVRSS